MQFLITYKNEKEGNEKKMQVSIINGYNYDVLVLENSVYHIKAQITTNSRVKSLRLEKEILKENGFDPSTSMLKEKSVSKTTYEISESIIKEHGTKLKDYEN